MTRSPPRSRREPDIQRSQNPDLDNGSASDTETAKKARRKRAQSSSGGPSSVACDQCRLRKVRCDRQQPNCSNCQKSGVVCSTSSALKRVNQTNQLRGDISVVLERLDHIDATLAALNQFVHQAGDQPCRQRKAGRPDSSSSSGNQVQVDPTEVDFDKQPDPPASIITSSPSSFVVSKTFESDEGGKLIYEYSAPFVLLKVLLRQASDSLLESEEQNEDYDSRGKASDMARALQTSQIRLALSSKLEEFPFESHCPEPAVAGNDKFTTTPLRFLYNQYVEGYMKHFNTRTPIFNNTELHDATVAYHDENMSKAHSAWALVLNNVVLLELGLQMRAGWASQLDFQGMDDDTLQSLLRNCDIAIGNLHTFTEPSLVNVQALMTLILVGRDFYSHEVTRKHSFMTGLPCNLHMFDSDHRPFTDAFGCLANLWEDIHLGLYASRAARANDEARAEQVKRLSSSLDRYCLQHVKSLPTPQVNSENSYPVKMELVYGFYVSQVLVLRCDRPSNKSQKKMRELGRTSLRLLLAVSEPPLKMPQLALLRNLIGDYPMVSFFELSSYHLARLIKIGEVDEEVTADIALLRDVCKLLEILEHNNDRPPHVLHNRLKLGLRWAWSILQVLSETLISVAANKDGENYPSQASFANSPKNPLSLISPETFGQCPIRLPTVDNGDPKMLSLQPGEAREAGASGFARQENSDYLALTSIDPMNQSSWPLTSAACESDRASPTVTALTQLQQASGVMEGTADWDSGNMNYSHGDLGHGMDWS
ncbi:transcriptional regulatory protein [Paramyrothecium foliicola]|nr:transcriptional regulatory protein [Paramyrothecium foliicola]